jgi:hypothetical protein
MSRKGKTKMILTSLPLKKSKLPKSRKLSLLPKERRLQLKVVKKVRRKWINGSLKITSGR